MTAIPELDDTPTPMPPDGMFYDDMHVGLRFPEPPGVVIDSGLAALYTAISGDGLALTLDTELCRAVTASDRLLVNPALVMHVSVGASTVATRNVIGNLFYRNVVLQRQVFQGEMLRTVTGVRAMADARAKQGVAPRGKVILSIDTTNGHGETVVDLERCPLIGCRGDAAPGHRDELGSAAGQLDLADYVGAVPDWDLSPLGDRDRWAVGETRQDLQRDVVDMATALVRITHNQAAIHRDAEVSPYEGRLVYGGHTVALGQASLGRVLDGLATVVGWHSCNHTAPVFEGDILSSRHTLVADQPTANGAMLRAVHVEVDAIRPGTEPVKVLDWTPIVLTT